VHFEAALNVTWLVLGLCALASAGRSALKRAPGARKTPVWLHLVGVALIVAALFPYISATDDVLRIEQFSSQHNPHQQSSKRNDASNLIRLYETLDSPLLSRACEILLTLFVVCLICTPVVILSNPTAPLAAGRSPPTAKFA